MVVLAAAICTKGGKTLLSRQFVEMTRIRIEGILAAFPKLIGGSSKQHTFVETESIRYVYQPIENLIVLLVTTKGSNIMEDLDTLRLLSKVLPGICPMVTEDLVLDNAFDIVFAFDEAITLGYKENVTEQTIRTNLEMESHEEKLQQMITASKIVEAKETANKKRQEITQARREMKSRGIKMEGIGNPNFATPTADPLGGGAVGMGGGMGSGARGFGDSTMDGNDASTYPGSVRSESKPAPSIGAGKKLKKGMQLKKKEKDSSFMQQMIAEDDIDSSAMKGDSSASGAAAATAAPAVQRMEDLEVSMTEKVSLELTKDGGVNSLDVQGLMQVTCFKPDLKLKLQLAESGPVEGYRFQTNPTVGKPGFVKNKVLALKQADRSFPQDPFKLLSWRMSSTDESKVPLLINCWPQDCGNGQFNVNIEYTLEADIELNDVSIKIPLNSSGVPEVVSCDDGLHKFNSRYQLIEWNLQTISQDNPNGILEFNVEARDEDGFFPVSTSFTSVETLCPITISAVSSVEDEPIRFAVSKALTVERYDVVSI